METLSIKTVETLMQLRKDRLITAALVLALADDDDVVMQRIQALAETDNRALLKKNPSKREAYWLAESVRKVAEDILPALQLFVERKNNGAS